MSWPNGWRWWSPACNRASEFTAVWAIALVFEERKGTDMGLVDLDVNGLLSASGGCRRGVDWETFWGTAQQTVINWCSLGDIGLPIFVFISVRVPGVWFTSRQGSIYQISRSEHQQQTMCVPFSLNFTYQSRPVQPDCQRCTPAVAAPAGLSLSSMQLHGHHH